MWWGSFAPRCAMSCGTLVYALQNGAVLDYGEGRAAAFDVKCPDGGRVVLHGEAAGE